MNREDLNNKLYYIRDESDKHNAEEMLNILDEIFKFKPVTILYFNVRAKVLCEQEKYEDAIEMLKLKINLRFMEEEYIETCKIFQKAYKAINSETYYKQWLCLEFYIRYIITRDEDSLEKIDNLEKEIINMEDSFFDNIYNDQIEIKLANAYWESWYTLESTIMYALGIKKYNIDYKESLFFKERIECEINYSFMFEQLINVNNIFILLSTKDDYARIMVLAKAINCLEKEVYVIMPPVLAEVDKDTDINDTIDISMENMEVDNDGIKKIRAIEISYNNNIVGNNTDLLMKKILENTEIDFSIVIGNGELFNSMSRIETVKKYMQRLSDFSGNFFEKNMQFGYFGSYLSYISNIYSMDVKEEIEKSSECEFSIVIPVRNSAESLRYTLQTCLEQRGVEKNDYEIIVSDNSAPDYTGVETLVKEINDSRIRYFRTPGQLQLGRSFEYAFVKAKGEFVFSLGADDALLPWGLETIRNTLKIFPDDDVIQWDRGFFVWPNNTVMSSQAGQFLIPKPYNGQKVNIIKYKCEEELINILYNPSLLYGLPMLYINSGFRRRYINKLFECTGRLWDGGSQDIYIGVVNLIINETIPYVQVPITIAGMSVSSIGAEVSNGNNPNKECISNKMNYSEHGNIVRCGNERALLNVDLDIALLYSSFFRILNIYQSDKINLINSKLDLKKIFGEVATKLSYNSLKFDYDIQSIRYSAYYNNIELGKWFDDNILQGIRELKILIANDAKSYKEGFNENGGLQLDSRKFNVNNIYEATKFFADICNL
jgi:hypothetical protein